MNKCILYINSDGLNDMLLHTATDVCCDCPQAQDSQSLSVHTLPEKRTCGMGVCEVPIMWLAWSVYGRWQANIIN